MNVRATPWKAELGLGVVGFADGDWPRVDELPARAPVWPLGVASFVAEYAREALDELLFVRLHEGRVVVDVALAVDRLGAGWRPVGKGWQPLARTRELLAGGPDLEQLVARLEGAARA